MKKINKSLLIITIIFIGIFGFEYISFGASGVKSSEIDSRGLVFNTGKSSDQIRLLKDFFRTRGSKDVSWGYDYDYKTKNLVREYQREKGIKADGIAGKTTIDNINNEIRRKNYKIGLRVPYTSIKGDMIIINKSSNTLYLLNNGVIKNSYAVATGKSSKLTPNGKHKVVTKAKNPSWSGGRNGKPIPGGAPNNPLGKRWIGISYGGGGKYGIHGNTNKNSIGTYASLGCVRMFNSDVEKLYDKVKINTPTWIGDEETLISYGVKFKSILEEVKVSEKKEVNNISRASLKINGEILNLENPVINKSGTIYYPFREILEFLGAELTWDNESKISSGSIGLNTIEFKAESSEYKVNGAYQYMEKGQKPFLKNKKLYVPIRTMMENLGYNVNWDNADKIVVIDNL